MLVQGAWDGLIPEIELPCSPFAFFIYQTFTKQLFIRLYKIQTGKNEILLSCQGTGNVSWERGREEISANRPLAEWAASPLPLVTYTLHLPKTSPLSQWLPTHSPTTHTHLLFSIFLCIRFEREMYLFSSKLNSFHVLLVTFPQECSVTGLPLLNSSGHNHELLLSVCWVSDSTYIISFTLSILLVLFADSVLNLIQYWFSKLKFKCTPSKVTWLVSGRAEFESTFLSLWLD